MSVPWSSGANALEVVAGLTSAISRAADLGHIYKAALDGLHHGLGVERSSILLFDPDGVIRFKAWRGVSEGYRQQVEGHSPWRPDTTDARVFGIADVRSDPGLAPYLPVIEAEGIRAMAFVPLISRGGVIGKLMCYYPAVHALTESEGVLAQTIADQVAFAVERTRNEEALVRNESRLRFALDAASMGTWDWDLRRNEVRWSENLERVHGLAPGTFGGDFSSYEREIHPDDRERVLASTRRAIAQGTPHEVEYRIVAPDGSIQWVEGKGRVEFDGDGQPVRMAGVCMAIGRRKQAELDRAAMVARTTLVAEASVLLGRSLDCDETLQSLAQCLVPRLADLCVIDLRRDDGRIEAAGMAVSDQEPRPDPRVLRQRFPVDPEAPYGPAQVVRTGEPLLASDVPSPALDVVDDPLLREAITAIGVHSALIVPIRDSGAVIGAMTLLATSQSTRRYDRDDLATALEIAQRAGVAIENARLYRSAQEANRIKDEFLATLSHELRTPLNAILGWARMIERGVLPPDRAAHGITSIRRNAEAQSRLIGDILDIARIRSGKLQLAIERVDLHTIVTAATETLEAEAEAKNITLEVTSKPGLLVRADPARLQQIIWNLVSNAVKFTPAGGQVRVEAWREAGRARIAVRDTGIGIDRDFLPRVFERFRQADASTTRSHSGLGLGLAITKHLAELHGGTVEAASDGPGSGSSFTLDLPLAPSSGSSAANLPADGKRRRGTPLSDRRVLVVDDDPDSRQLVAMILSNAGAHVDTAASAAAAYERAVSNGYDLVVADIAMPGEDGFSLVRRIRARFEGGAAVPAIAVTAHAREEDRAMALAVGFSAHLAKPFDPERLLELATVAIGRHHDARH